jgi:hypothetical protein
LPAVPRVDEIDHQLQLRAITALLFPQLGGVEFQLIAPHLRFEQTRSADAPARNIEAIKVALAIEDVERSFRWRDDAVSRALDGLAVDERAAVRTFLRRLVDELQSGVSTEGAPGRSGP